MLAALILTAFAAWFLVTVTREDREFRKARKRGDLARADRFSVPFGRR